MRKFERELKTRYKPNGDLKEYQISLGVNTEIEEDRFHQNDSGRMVCDVIVCFPDEFEEMTGQLQHLKEENKSLTEWKELKTKRIEKLENLLSDIHKSNRKEMNSAANEYTKEIDRLNEDLHEKDLEIEKVRTEYEAKIGKIKADYERQIGDFKEKIQKEINELELFDTNKHMTIKAHNEEVSNLELFDAEYHMKKEDHQKELNKMRGNCLKLRVRDGQKYSSFIYRLDNFSRFEKALNKDKEILKEMADFNQFNIDEESLEVEFNLIGENEKRNR